MSLKTRAFIPKLLCIALALLMLVGGLVSCSKEDDKNKPDATPNTQAPSDETEAPKDEKPIPYMDNFGNYEFRILSPNNYTGIVGDMPSNRRSSAVPMPWKQNTALPWS